MARPFGRTPRTLRLLQVEDLPSSSLGTPCVSRRRLSMAGLVFIFVSQADPTTSFESAQSAAKLLGDRATLIEQLDVGHTSVVQYSTCTLGIIVNFVLASKVFSLSWLV